LLQIVLYIVIGISFLSLLAWAIQEKLIFKPEKLKQHFQFKYDVPFEELFFDIEEGVCINGLHFYRPFYRYNYDVVLVDYRGFGKSTGKRSEKEMLADMQFVYSKLAAQYPEHHILVYGRSMGSGFATKVASDNNPRYLILDAPYYSFRKVAERFTPFLPHRWILRYHLRTDKWIRKVNCHTYIIHGSKDWLIPIKHSRKLQALNPQKITLIEIAGGGHNNLPKFNEYHNFIRDILKYS
jgi:uncharacterized protein